MPPSTLKLYIDIAKTLMKHGPLTTQDLSLSLKVNTSSLKERINFLINEKLIKEKDRDSSATYIITKRGTEILKFFNAQPSIKIINDKK